MSLFLSLLPLYLVGNLHCFGMCGPLVMTISRHRCRYFYFAGRLLSFTLAAGLAGGFGWVLHLLLNEWNLAALVSIVFGSVLIFLGISRFLPFRFHYLEKKLAFASQSLAYLILKDKPWPLFLFGFFTIMLPCGQSLIVLAACAVTGSPSAGLFNGFAFALITTPSLLTALHLHALARTAIPETLISLTALIVGSLSVLRGLAEFDIIPHGVINQNYHIILW